MEIKAVAIDTETYLIEPGVFAPKTVCGSFHNGNHTDLMLAEPAAAMVERVLRDGYVTVWANPGFDLATLCQTRPSLFPLFVDALRNDRVWCVQIGQKLIDIADGCRKGRKYNLAALTDRFFGFKMDKDTWRLRYAELDGIPVDEWPAGAQRYARLDAKFTWDLFRLQRARVAPDAMGARVRFDVAAYWMSREGVGVDPDRIVQLEGDTLAAIAEMQPEFVAAGLLKDRNRHTGQSLLFGGGSEKPDWGKDYDGIKRRIRKSGVVLRDKHTNNIRTDAGALRETGDPVLERFADYGQHVAVWTKDLPFLIRGFADRRIHTRFDTLLDTGRVSSVNPNLLNLRRAPGVRECIVPRAGHVFLDCDYSSAELHTLGQTLLDLFGASRLADVLNAGKDPHVMMAGNIAGIADYDEMKAHAELKFYRQLAKIPNFGLPGGMSAEGLDAYARNYGVKLGETGFTAERLVDLWHETWPEMRSYFAWIKRNLPTIALTRGSRRVRKSDEFCAQCNYLFQGLAAEGLALATWAVFEECYVDESSVMFGCKPLLPIHDELLVEAPADRADECLARLSEIMATEFNRIVPDCPTDVEGEIKERFRK